MIEKYIDGRVIIANMHDEFNITSRDWENRTPRWIAKALSFLHISLQYGSVTKPIKFTDYEFDLPCSIDVLRQIIINDIKLDFTNTPGHELIRKNLEENGITDRRYYSIINGKVTLEIESGTAHVVYTKAPVTWSEELSMYVPMVPDIPEVIDNIQWYILKVILARGYKHPVYSLTSQNPYNNPDLRWRETRREAQFRARAMTKEGRRIMAETLSEFIADPDADIHGLLKEDFRTNLNIDK